MCSALLLRLTQLAPLAPDKLPSAFLAAKRTTHQGHPWRRVERALEAQQSVCDAQYQHAPATPHAGAAGHAVEAATRASRPLSASNTDRRRAAEDAAPGKENGHASAPAPPETVTPAPKQTVHPHSRVRAAEWANICFANATVFCVLRAKHARQAP